MSATVVTPTNVTAHDRLGITLFLAIAFHVAIILGITFNINRDGDEKQNLPTLDVTLVNSTSEDESIDPDYLAQSNQIGTGNTEEKVNPQAPPDAAAEVIPNPGNAAEITPPDPLKKQSETIEQAILTAKKSKTEIAVGEQSPPQDDARIPAAAELIRRSLDLAKLEWELAELKKVHTEKADIKTGILLPNTKSAVEAAYLDQWQKKVETIGNLNYPDKAKRTSGDVILVVTIRSDGSLEETSILKSSGNKILDDAAMRIAKMAAPYAPFPDELSKKFEVLRIPRTWKFSNGSTNISAR